MQWHLSKVKSSKEASGLQHSKVSIHLSFRYQVSLGTESSEMQIGPITLNAVDFQHK